MNILETITCPLEGTFLNKEFDLYTIFDITSINRAVNYKVDYVHKVLLYIIKNPSLPETEKMDKYLKKQLNQDCYNTYHQIINNFDNENQKFKRYYYVDDDKQIFNLFDTYETIFKLINVLQDITIKEIRRRKEM